MADTLSGDWRIVEVLKLLRQCVVCPFCGVLVSTDAGISAHKAWHNQLQNYVESIDAQLANFSDYIINPTTGLQKQIQDRLDTITNYVIAPVTGLEARTVAAITNTNQSVTTLRNDATGAITGLSGRVSTVEDEIVRPTTGIRARLTALEALGLN